MSYDTLLVEHDGPVAWLIFNRPDVGNAMNAAMFDDLARAWIDLDQNPDVRVVVVTGQGKAFNTGLDIASLAREPESLRKIRREMRDYDMHFTARHQHVAKPVIAAVNGVCAGGGLQFVTDSDIAVCSSNASFLDPHVSVGQTVGYSAFTLARTIPFGTAMRLALTGRHERISAVRALEVGLVGQVVDPPEELRGKGAGVGREHRPQLPDRARAFQAERCGARCRWDWTRRVAPGPATSPRCGITPTKPKDRLLSRQKREAQWQPPAAGRRS